MTIASLYNDMIFLGVFLLAGFALREIIKPLQKLFLPASLIGGVLALILGQQVLGIVQVPDSFSSMSGTLINVIMAALVFGVTINKNRIVSYLDYSCVCQGVYGMQMALGALLGAGLALIWPGLPNGWGAMGVFAFHGGHGTANAAGAVFEELGIAENMTVGMVLSTFGLVIAMTIGMVIVNWGIKKGYTAYVHEPQKQPAWYFGGPLPEAQRKPTGRMVTTSIGINHLALQVAWLLLATFIGKKLFWASSFVWSGVNSLPTLMQGLVGAVILWPILCKLKLDSLVDISTIKQISGFCLEIVVLTAMATLKLQFIATFIVPLLIYTAICTVVTAILSIGCSRAFCQKEWFEKAVMVFGMGTGTTATGLALVRAVDPNSESSAGDAHGVYSSITCWNNLFTAIVPVWMMTGLGMTVGVGFGMFAVCMILGFGVFARAKKKAMGA